MECQGYLLGLRESLPLDATTDDIRVTLIVDGTLTVSVWSPSASGRSRAVISSRYSRTVLSSTGEIVFTDDPLTGSILTAGQLQLVGFFGEFLWNGTVTWEADVQRVSSTMFAFGSGFHPSWDGLTIGENATFASFANTILSDQPVAIVVERGTTANQNSNWSFSTGGAGLLGFRGDNDPAIDLYLTQLCSFDEVDANRFGCPESWSNDPRITFAPGDRTGASAVQVVEAAPFVGRFHWGSTNSLVVGRVGRRGFINLSRAVTLTISATTSVDSAIEPSVLTENAVTGLATGIIVKAGADVTFTDRVQLGQNSYFVAGTGSSIHCNTYVENYSLLLGSNTTTDVEFFGNGTITCPLIFPSYATFVGGFPYWLNSPDYVPVAGKLRVDPARGTLGNMRFRTAILSGTEAAGVDYGTVELLEPRQGQTDVTVRSSTQFDLLITGSYVPQEGDVYVMASLDDALDLKNDLETSGNSVNVTDLDGVAGGSLCFSYTLSLVNDEILAIVDDVKCCSLISCDLCLSAVGCNYCLDEEEGTDVGCLGELGGINETAEGRSNEEFEEALCGERAAELSALSGGDVNLTWIPIDVCPSGNDGDDGDDGGLNVFVYVGLVLTGVLLGAGGFGACIVRARARSKDSEFGGEILDKEFDVGTARGLVDGSGPGEKMNKAGRRQRKKQQAAAAAAAANK